MTPINPLQAPINYAVDVASPFEAALGGFKAGLAGAESQAKTKESLAREAEYLSKTQGARDKERQQQTAVSVATDPMSTRSQVLAATVGLDPAQAKIITDGFNSLSEEKKQPQLNFLAGVYSAFASGAPEIGKGQLQAQEVAYNNAGMKREAQAITDALKLIDINPVKAMEITGQIISAIPGGNDLLANISKAQELGISEDAREANLSKSESDSIIRRLEAEFAPEQLETDLSLKKGELAQAAKDQSATRYGKIPEKNRPEAEAKLRAEYYTNTKTYQDVKDAYASLGATQDTAVGDVALIFSYMKMLDPGSVVREGEYATAQNTAGIPDQVMNLYNKLVDGERLNPKQRASFKGQAKSLYAAAAKKEVVVRKGITNIGNRYGLNIENIFYSDKEVPPTNLTENPATPTPGTTKTTVNKGNTGSKIRVTY
jgi:hypothetical protein